MCAVKWVGRRLECVSSAADEADLREPGSYIGVLTRSTVPLTSLERVRSPGWPLRLVCMRGGPTCAADEPKEVVLAFVDVKPGTDLLETTCDSHALVVNT